ncbi:uncharacterized [Tachysurus ichikawai]
MDSLAPLPETLLRWSCSASRKLLTNSIAGQECILLPQYYWGAWEKAVLHLSLSHNSPPLCSSDRELSLSLFTSMLSQQLSSCHLPHPNMLRGDVLRDRPVAHGTAT